VSATTSSPERRRTSGRTSTTMIQMLAHSSKSRLRFSRNHK
jgi:hypothetical protein